MKCLIYKIDTVKHNHYCNNTANFLQRDAVQFGRGTNVKAEHILPPTGYKKVETSKYKNKMVTGHYTTNCTTEAAVEDDNWPLHYKLNHRRCS
jgi:hypothetical protein